MSKFFMKLATATTLILISSTPIRFLRNLRHDGSICSQRLSFPLFRGFASLLVPFTSWSCKIFPPPPKSRSKSNQTNNRLDVQFPDEGVLGVLTFCFQFCFCFQTWLSKTRLLLHHRSVATILAALPSPHQQGSLCLSTCADAHSWPFSQPGHQKQRETCERLIEGYWRVQCEQLIEGFNGTT